GIRGPPAGESNSPSNLAFQLSLRHEGLPHSLPSETICFVHATAVASPVTSPPKLLDRVRQHLRVKHYSIRTEQAYTDWIKRFILFHGKRHPKNMGEDEIGAFLTHLAAMRHVAASTQNQALSALLFLYHEVFDRKLNFMDKIDEALQ